MSANSGKDSRIPHSASSLGEAEIRAVAEVVKNNYVGHGPVSAQLEVKISQATGKKYAFAVSSGFHALALAVRALDLPPSSLIALPVLTCASVLGAVQGAGHKAWLTDIDGEKLTIDPRTIPASAASVIAPHAYGAALEVEALAASGKPWIEDCATMPVTANAAQPPGASGTLAIFSFNSTKYLTGGSGGMVLTDDQVFATRIEDLLAYDSFDKNGKWRHGVPGVLPGRLSDLNAALALSQWEQLAEALKRRRAIAEIYDAGLQQVPGLFLPKLTADHAFYRYIVRTMKPSVELAGSLREAGIDARTSVNPWLNDAAEAGVKILGGPWPSAEKWRNHMLSLPIHLGITDDQAEFVAGTLAKICN